MAVYEYQVIPAPAKGAKVKSVRSPEMRFSLTLQDLMNDMGAEGWEYQRAETLPSIERAGLTGSSTNWRHVLVFRREIVSELDFEDDAQMSAPHPSEAGADIALQDPGTQADDPDVNRPPLVAERGT